MDEDELRGLLTLSDNELAVLGYSRINLLEMYSRLENWTIDEILAREG